MIQALPEGIQGASQEALPATGRAPRTLSPAFRQAEALGTSVSRLPVIRKSVRRQQCTFAVSISHKAPPSKSHAASSNTPAKAIVMGASVAGLLTAAALSDYVDTVTVLDKDAFVSEKLSHDELKQVISTVLAPGSGFVHAVTSQVTAAFSEGYASKHVLTLSLAHPPVFDIGMCILLAAIPLSWGAVLGKGSQPQGCAAVHPIAWAPVWRCASLTLVQ